MKHDRTGPASFELLHARSKTLDFIICENVLRHLKIDNFYPAPSDTCLITNVTDDHLHQTKSKTIQEIARIKSKLLTRCKESSTIILNGDNKYTRDMSSARKDCKLIFFTTLKPTVTDLQKLHPQSIYYLDNKSVLRLDKKLRKKMILKNLASLPLTLDMRLKFNVYNILAAVCVLDNIENTKIAPKNLAEKLAEIKLSYAHIPGRFNIFNFKEFMVILDDAHNPESYNEAFRTAKLIQHKRLISVIKASSTRTGEFIKKLGRIAAKNSDLIYVKESFAKDSKKKKQFGGKIAKLLKEGISQTGFPSVRIKTLLDEEEAVKAAIKNAQKDDLILIFGYRINNLSKLISRLKQNYLQSKKP